MTFYDDCEEIAARHREQIKEMFLRPAVEAAFVVCKQPESGDEAVSDLILGGTHKVKFTQLDEVCPDSYRAELLVHNHPAHDVRWATLSAVDLSSRAKIIRCVVDTENNNLECFAYDPPRSCVVMAVPELERTTPLYDPFLGKRSEK